THDSLSLSLSLSTQPAICGFPVINAVVCYRGIRDLHQQTKINLIGDLLIRFGEKSIKEVSISCCMYESSR
ncbi:unnamed protein product, partial [Arabidopsis halleri]